MDKINSNVKDNSELGHLVQKCRRLLVSNSSYVIGFVKRVNGVAH